MLTGFSFGTPSGAPKTALGTFGPARRRSARHPPGASERQARPRHRGQKRGTLGLRRRSPQRGHAVSATPVRPVRAARRSVSVIPLPCPVKSGSNTRRTRAGSSERASGRPDSNRGPHRPERCALPGCATPRRAAQVSHRSAAVPDRYRRTRAHARRDRRRSSTRCSTARSIRRLVRERAPGSRRARRPALVTGVSANRALLEAAAASGADLVLVHHGLFWGPGVRAIDPVLHQPPRAAVRRRDRARRLPPAARRRPRVRQQRAAGARARRSAVRHVRRAVRQADRRPRRARRRSRRTTSSPSRLSDVARARAAAARRRARGDQPRGDPDRRRRRRARRRRGRRRAGADHRRALRALPGARRRARPAPVRRRPPRNRARSASRRWARSSPGATDSNTASSTSPTRSSRALPKGARH